MTPDDPHWHPDGSALEQQAAEHESMKALLQRIADAGPMFSPDDWRWSEARALLLWMRAVAA